MSAKTAARNDGKGSYAIQVEQRIREMTKPLRDELRGINQRLSEIMLEAEELKESRKRIEQVLKRIDPTSFVATPKKTVTSKHVGSPEVNEQRRQAVLGFLEAHRDQYEDGIIAAVVYRDMKAAGIEPVMSPEKIRVLIKELHAQGILRADKRVRGGAVAYQFIGNGGANAEA